MVNGISQLENRDWKFKQNVSFIGHVSESSNRYELVEHFTKLPQLNASTAYSVNENFEILGTNASNDDVTVSSTIAGIVLETDGAGNDQVIVLPHLTSGLSTWTGIKWGTENQVVWECVLRTGAAITNVCIWAGLKLTNTSVVATDDDQIFFRMSTAIDSDWRAVSSIAGTDTQTDTGIVVAVNTTYKLKISVDSSRKATFYINDTAYYTTAALTNDVDLIPYVGVQDLAAAARSIILCRESISRIWYE